MDRSPKIRDLPYVQKALRSIAANVRRLRLKKKWTQENLSEASGIEARYIQTIESGRVDPGSSIIVALAHAFGVRPGVLFRPTALTTAKPGRPAQRKAGKASRARKERR